ncbi:MAG: CPBP family intramembrane metalloprotease [Caldilineaceae bacterium]|nr:CPBP family intramembrane metalloprotease [Caldilineaceae bacterium]
MSTLAVNAKPTLSVSLKRAITNHPLVAYFAIAFAGSWLFWLPLTLSKEVNGLGLLPFTPSETTLYTLGTIGGFAGPPLAAFLVTAIASGRAGVNALLRSCVQWRVGIQWYFVVIFGALLVYLAGFGTVYGTNLFQALMQQWTLLVTLFLPATIFSLVTANFGEEIGWRGFAMPRLQQRYGPILATIILGGLHSLWHLPLLFTRLLGPTNPLDFAGFVAAGVAMTCFYTWIFNHTRGSVLMAALFHAFSNGAIGLAAMLIPADIIVSGWARPLINGGWKGDILFTVGGFALLLLIFTRGRLGYIPDPTRTQ